MTDPGHRYDDIIGMEHPTSASHPRMTSLERAAQFAPFAALTGFGDMIEEGTIEHNAHDTVLTSEEIDDI